MVSRALLRTEGGLGVTLCEWGATASGRWGADCAQELGGSQDVRCLLLTTTREEVIHHTRFISYNIIGVQLILYIRIYRKSI